MIPYIIFYFIIFLLSFKIKKEKYTVYDFLLLTIMIGFSGIRYGIGTDYVSYEGVFNYFSSDSITLMQGRTGIGFSYLMYFVKYILHMNFQFVIVLCSFFTNLLIYRFIKRNSEQPGRAILIYISLGFYTLSFNMFRQMLSIAFILTGFESLKRGKKIFAIILYLIALFIHSSAIIAIIVLTCLYFFIKKRFKLWPILAGATIFLVFYNTLYYNILSNFDGFEIYATKEYLPGVGTYINVAVYFVLYIIFIHFTKKNFKNTEEKNLQLNAATIGLGIVTLELKNFLFVRIATPFIIFFPILIAESYEIYNFRKKRLESLIFYSCLFVYFLVYTNSFGEVVPYTTVLGLF